MASFEGEPDEVNLHRRPEWTERRYPELDAIRGLAALFVIFHHFMLIFHRSWTVDTGPWALLWHPFIAGHERVAMFYLLSGFVLTLPYLQERQQSYRAFLVRRIVRIYGPYMAALALSVAGAALLHRHLGMGSYVEATWSEPVSARLVWAHLLLVGNYDWTQFNTAFWSLVYEARISLVFPALYLLTSRLRTRFAIALAGVLTLCGQFGEFLFSSRTFTTMEYAAIFVAGILLAKHHGLLSEWYRRRSIGSKLGLLGGSFLLYGQAFRMHGSNLPFVWRTVDGVMVLGAMGLVVTALNSKRAGRMLRTGIPQFLGRISYSLYLVHGTVLFATLMLCRREFSQAEFLTFYVICSIGIATLFHQKVEVPFVALSRRAGRWMEALAPVELPSLDDAVKEL